MKRHLREWIEKRTAHLEQRVKMLEASLEHQRRRPLLMMLNMMKLVKQGKTIEVRFINRELKPPRVVVEAYDDGKYHRRLERPLEDVNNFNEDAWTLFDALEWFCWEETR